jgi:hypothetical protein
MEFLSHPRTLAVASLLLTSHTWLAPDICRAQAAAMPVSQTKAANLARLRAESINGGLSNYRADRCMYSTGAPDCLVEASPAAYVFRFQGGAPGWQQRRPVQPTVVTTVTVSADGEVIRSVTNKPLP